MSLTGLLALIRKRRRRSVEQSFEEGAQITKRLQELLSAPCSTLESSSSNAPANHEPTPR